MDKDQTETACKSVESVCSRYIISVNLNKVYVGVAWCPVVGQAGTKRKILVVPIAFEGYSDD